MDKEAIKKMTLREVMDFTRYIPINEGGLKILIEKIICEIENLEIKINDLLKKKNE